MVEEEYEEEKKEIIERLDESYICYNCGTELYLCSHNYWLCHNCENSSDPAKFESYPNGVLSPGGVSTLLKGVKNSKFNPSELEHSDGRVRLLNKNQKNSNRECNLWAIEADLYSSDSLVNQILQHHPVFLLPYNHTRKLKRRIHEKFFPPLVSLNGRRNISIWENYSVGTAEWRNSGFWKHRGHHLRCALLSLKEELFANNNKSNVVAMLPFGSGQYSEISWIPRCLLSDRSPITDILFFHKDSDDFNDIPKVGVYQNDERIIKTSSHISN